MKCKEFIFCLFISCPCYATVVVSSPTDLATVPSGSDIIINNGGEYNFSYLLDANTVTVDFDIMGGGENSTIVFDIGSEIGNVIDVPIISQEDIRIKLMNDFLNDIPGETENILQFNHLTMNADVHISEENISSTYNYNWVPCGAGLCVSRVYSGTYRTSQLESYYAEQVAVTGVQNNSKMLLYPMTTVNRHALLDFYKFSDEFFISVSPDYYNAKKFQNMGIRLNVGGKIGGRLLFGVEGYALKSNFQNNVSNFKSDVYGGNLRFNYSIDEILFLRGIAGMSFSNINCNDIIDGDKIVNNPDAVGFYGGMDFGAKFDFESGLFLSPFIGYDIEHEKVISVTQNDSFMHFGNDIGFKYFMDGVSYDYILRIGVNSFGKFDAGVGIGVWLVSDKVGGAVSFGVLDTDFGMTSKLSADVKFAF